MLNSGNTSQYEALCSTAIRGTAKKWKLLYQWKQLKSCILTFAKMQVLDLQEQMIPSEQIGKGCLPSLALERLQIQWSPPPTPMNYLKKLLLVGQQFPVAIKLETWSKMPDVVASCCYSADKRGNAQWLSATTQVHSKEMGYSVSHSNFLKGDKIMQPKLKKGQYITPLNVAPLPSIACTIIWLVLPQLKCTTPGSYTATRICTCTGKTDILPWSFLYSELMTSAFLKMRDTLALYPEENMVLFL